MEKNPGQATARQKSISVEQAAAFHLATIEHDQAGESTGRILHEVQALVPGATEPDLMQALNGFAEKKLIKIKPDGFVRVNAYAVNHFTQVAQQIA